MAKHPRLWSPISQALDVYKRSSYGGKASNYEQLWRLVQLHEAVVGVLTVLTTARVLDCFATLPDDAKDDSAELLLGRARADGDIDTVQTLAPLAGGTEEKVVFLQKAAILGGDPFLDELKVYLDGEVADPQLKGAVEQIGNLKIMQDDRISRLSLLRGIMYVRNKVAHVPLPSDVARVLVDALKVDVGTLLGGTGESVLALNHRNIPQLLKGFIHFQTASLTGTDHEEASTRARNATACWSNEETSLTWRINPFILVGDQLKVWVLAHLNEPLDAFKSGSENSSAAAGSLNPDDAQFQGQGEYHRYAAEHRSVDIKQCYLGESYNAVVDHWARQVAPKAVEPSVLTQAPKKSLPKKQPVSVRDLRSEAYELLRRWKFDEADAKFDEVYRRSEEEEQPWEYNESTSLMHGLANLSIGKDGHVDYESREKALRKAVKLFKESSGHKDPSVRARALHELSKAYYHLSRMPMNPDPEALRQAVKAADETLHFAADQQYQSWKSFLLERAPKRNAEEDGSD